MLSVHGDELAAYALQLWQGHGRGRKLDGLLYVLYRYLTTSFSLVVFLVCHDLGEDVRRCLVELVEVVLFRCWFLMGSARRTRWEGSLRHTSTVAIFGLTTFVLPSLPMRASHIWSHGGVSSSSTTMNSGLSHRVMPLGSSYLKIRFSKSSSS